MMEKNNLTKRRNRKC